MIHFRETDYGFEFGSAKVRRVCSDKTGAVWITIETSKHKGHDAIQVKVTKTGFVRIFRPGKERSDDAR